MLQAAAAAAAAAAGRCRWWTPSRQTAGIRQSGGATDVPPHTCRATSASVSDNLHRWPAGSSAVHCRSPYGKSVGTTCAQCSRAGSQ